MEKISFPPSFCMALCFSWRPDVSLKQKLQSVHKGFFVYSWIFWNESPDGRGLSFEFELLPGSRTSHLCIFRGVFKPEGGIVFLVGLYTGKSRTMVKSHQLSVPLFFLSFSPSYLQQGKDVWSPSLLSAHLYFLIQGNDLQAQLGTSSAPVRSNTLM